MKNAIFTLSIIGFMGIFGWGSLSADSVKIKKTGTVYQNVKTSTEKGVVTVDFEDGSQKKFRSKDVAVTSEEVVWLEVKEEEPNFIQRWFGSSEKSDSNEDKSPDTTAAKSTDSQDSGTDQDEEAIPYLGEGIFGGVVVLFLVLP